MYGAIRYERQVKIVEGGRNEVRSEAGVPAVSAQQGGVLVVSVPDLQEVVATVPAALNIEVPGKCAVMWRKYNTGRSAVTGTEAVSSCLGGPLWCIYTGGGGDSWQGGTGTG